MNYKKYDLKNIEKIISILKKKLQKESLEATASKIDFSKHLQIIGVFGNLVGDLEPLGDNNRMSISRYKSKRRAFMMAARAANIVFYHELHWQPWQAS